MALFDPVNGPMDQGSTKIGTLNPKIGTLNTKIGTLNTKIGTNISLSCYKQREKEKGRCKNGLSG
jgi:hypothetical protein